MPDFKSRKLKFCDVFFSATIIDVLPRRHWGLSIAGWAAQKMLYPRSSRLPTSSLFTVLELNGMKMQSIKDDISLYFLVPCIPYSVARNFLYRRNLAHIYYAIELLL